MATNKKIELTAKQKEDLENLKKAFHTCWLDGISFFLWDYVNLIALNDENLEEYHEASFGTEDTDEIIDIRDLPSMTIDASQPEDFELAIKYKSGNK